MAVKSNSSTNQSTVKLSNSQREVLRRLANTEYRLIQHWYTGKCYWVKGICEHWQREAQNSNVINALNDRDLLKEYSNRVYLNSGVYTELTVSDAGRCALSGIPYGAGGGGPDSPRANEDAPRLPMPAPIGTPRDEEIELELSKQGLRRAASHESGWYAYTSYGTVWATDLPLPEPLPEPSTAGAERKPDYGYGWKFLTPAGTTESDSHGSFEYTLPARGEKWSAVTAHPTPCEPDGYDCGPNRLHVMNKPDARYAPKQWWPWYARYDTSAIIGKSTEKVSVAHIQLRRIKPKVFHRIIRLGWTSGANLSWADLSYADLRYANLSGANLSWADLSYANLSGANLSGANLSWANLRGANLRYANLSGANLSWADLSYADLRGANLSGANLSWADLRYADLRYADLSYADLREADLRGADLSYADLRYADLSGADLSGVNLRGVRNREYAIGLPSGTKSDDEDEKSEDDSEDDSPAPLSAESEVKPS